ncbi:MAG: hypothetical protein ABSD20_15125 [Terriglobales bacterium]
MSTIGWAYRSLLASKVSRASAIRNPRLSGRIHTIHARTGASGHSKSAVSSAAGVGIPKLASTYLSSEPDVWYFTVAANAAGNRLAVQHASTASAVFSAPGAISSCYFATSDCTEEDELDPDHHRGKRLFRSGGDPDLGFRAEKIGKVILTLLFEFEGQVLPFTA